jgi:hypothetical protein
VQVAVSVTEVPAGTVDDGVAAIEHEGGEGGGAALRKAEMNAASEAASLSEMPPGKMPCMVALVAAASWIRLGLVPT